MNDDRVYIKPSTSHEGVRFQEDTKKPSGAVTSSKSFKRVLDKEDEDRSTAQGKVSEKKDPVEEESDPASIAASAKSPRQTKETKSTASNEEVFSLFGTQKGKATQKQPTLLASADVSEDTTIQEDEAEVNPQQTVSKNTNADSGTQVRAPKAPRQSEQQSLLETTFTQSAAIASQEKPKPLIALKESKPVQTKSTATQGESARVTAQGEGNKNVQWDDEDAPKQFGYDDLSDASKDSKLTGEAAIAANQNTPLIQPKKETPVFNLSQSRTVHQVEKEIGLESPSVSDTQIRPKGLGENPLAYQQVATNDSAKINDAAKIAVMKEMSLQDESVTAKAAPVKTNIANPFAQEQVDLSSVNPQGFIAPVAPVGVTTNINTAAAAKPMPASATMYVLLDVLVKEISTMQAGDKTETTIILQRPPLFANAQVMITGYESAKGELNITFGNLTQNAQHVIEQQQQSLLLALETKGYQVHIFTATTLELQSPIASAQQSSQEQQRQSGQQQGKNQQQKGEGEEKEA